MANTVQIKRGNNTSVNAHTGPSGEIIYNLDTGRLHAQDGSTAGGHPHALISDVDLKANAATQVIAGDGLTGGGTLAASRTLALSSASIASLAKADTAVQPAIAITAGTGLTGGGTLAASRTVALNAASIASLSKADSALQAPGGISGQILAKNSATTNDVVWVSSEAATAVSYGPQTLTAPQQAQARGNIGAIAGYSDLGVIPNLQLPDRLKEFPPVLSDANSAVTTGFYVINASATNSTGAGAGFLQAMFNTPAYGRQIYWQRDGSRVFSRNLVNNVWRAWEEIGGGNIATNGWIKLPSGLIIQWGVAIVTLSANFSATITLPTTFPNNLFSTTLTNGDWGAPSQRTASLVIIPGTSKSSVEFAAGGGAASTPIRVNYVVFGN